MIQRRSPLLPLLFLLLCQAAGAQFSSLPTGANRPDVGWERFETEHFEIIYHEGLETIAREAADVAEAIYPVVTGNLRHPLPDRTPIFLSDLDEIPNAFARGDELIYIWMRGILDDMPLGGIRSAGSAKWLRAVITHEFTHTVIAHATQEWSDIFMPSGNVPRWFNEGTARFMEPDPWTTDIDQILRVAAVNGRLGYDGLGRLDGTLLYETGHSLVRYMTWRFGDTTLARIVNGGRGGFGSYDFDRAVVEATGMSMGEIHRDWYRAVTVAYGVEYNAREETIDISTPLLRGFEAVYGLRYAPDAMTAAFLAAEPGRPSRLWLANALPSGRLDSTRSLRLLSDQPGFDAQFSFSPDGSRLVLAKERFATHDATLRDLYLLDVASRDLTRLTDDARLSDPAWSPDGGRIAAVQKRLGRDRLVSVDPASGAIVPLYEPAGDVQLYTPSWSPDGARLAVSLFDTAGRRTLLILGSGGGVERTLADSAGSLRYPVWSPDGGRIAATSTNNGIPNAVVIDLRNGGFARVTDVAGGVYTMQWLPGTDSLVVNSFDTRDRIVPHLIPAGRRVTVGPAPEIRGKYTAWRDVELPLQVPSASAMPRASAGPVTSYSGLWEMSPQILVPVAATDRGVDGTAGWRGGLGTLFIDPLGNHTLALAADYGFASGEIGVGGIYSNDVLPFTITLGALHRVAFDDVIGDIPYYQKSTGAALAFGEIFRDPDLLTISHTFTLALGWRRITPWNTGELEQLRIGERPTEQTLSEATLGYGYGSRGLAASLTYRHAEPGLLGSTVGFNRFDGDVGARLPFGDWWSPAILLNLGGTAHWGGPILPQEFVGLDPYDLFEKGFDPLALESNRRVRGVRRYVPGDRVVVGSLGLSLPGEGALPLDWLLFVEGGGAWFADSTSIGDIDWLGGYGLELRGDLSGVGTLAAGIAFEMKERPRRDLYLRLSRGL